ncbi:3,4-dihydroxy-2-butanone-4-phosphate synthase [Aquicella lusitana]|uniref:Multifunctional fusion protein n=1 Tax=Aquicella lusitana TaxID=254246 RepID=A0A370GFX9_9COXI|nr:3,4-dihydroxy-2-butanone-4-phosphate synthase [Aquicella lusitana]RDI42577.1 GTP cyclohydrolase II /3,4-dihydroxy-2-butanone 4-phosphate synthase [Aquicella lusitana]VVC74356.1 Riboflavin biosynthesis protein RibBA [Aquicella lusitana]
MRPEIKRVEKALAELRQGRMVILTDDASRENEGDLVFPAEMITPEIMNFMIREGSGIVCLPLTSDKLKQLQLPLMVPPNENTSFVSTPFTISIDAKEVSGVSAADRVKTVQLAISDDAKPEDLARPGHVFPLHAKDGGVLERQGHTEGSIDLMRLAGLKPAAVICELMNTDGTMTRGEQLENFAAQHGLTLLSVNDILAYRLNRENLIEEETATSLPLENYGMFNITVIKEKITGEQHVVLSKAPRAPDEPLLVRVHSSCTTGDLFASQRCDCHQELHFALKKISEEGGMLIYLSQEGRGIGLFNKIKAYALQEQGYDTVEANQKLGLPVDARKYYIAANYLRNRHINRVQLLTNNPHKINDLIAYGVDHVTQVALPAFDNEHNRHYLLTKKQKLNHSIHLDLQLSSKEI